METPESFRCHPGEYTPNTSSNLADEAWRKSRQCQGQNWGWFCFEVWPYAFLFIFIQILRIYITWLTIFHQYYVVVFLFLWMQSLYLYKFILSLEQQVWLVWVFLCEELDALWEDRWVNRWKYKRILALSASRNEFICRIGQKWTL